MKKGVVVGWFLVLAATLSSACSSSDDEKLLKWECDCNHDVCAASEVAAKEDAGSCSSGTSYQRCIPTGDTCSCPGGASVCTIIVK